MQADAFALTNIVLPGVFRTGSSWSLNRRRFASLTLLELGQM
jgi:hypothetical protein